MSVIGALVERYNSDSDSEIVALRNAVGVGKCWRANVPDNKSMPYIALTDAGQSKDIQSTNIVVFTSRVQVDVWSNSAEQVESIIDLIEFAFVGCNLELGSKTLLQVLHGGGRTITSFEKSYRGMMELLVSYSADWS